MKSRAAVFRLVNINERGEVYLAPYLLLIGIHDRPGRCGSLERLVLEITEGSHSSTLSVIFIWMVQPI